MYKLPSDDIENFIQGLDLFSSHINKNCIFFVDININTMKTPNKYNKLIIIITIFFLR